MANRLQKTSPPTFFIPSTTFNPRLPSNAALGRVFALLAAGRIKRQDALSLAYMCQLMLQSLKGFKHEICLTTTRKSSSAIFYASSTRAPRSKR
jgi:hypothetical protein